MTDQGHQAWSVQVTPGAARALERLPRRTATAVLEFVTRTLPANPHRVSTPLNGDLEGLRGARRGDYRILVRVDDKHRIVLIVRIAHRRDAYRPL